MTARVGKNPAKARPKRVIRTAVSPLSDGGYTLELTLEDGTVVNLDGAEEELGKVAAQFGQVLPTIASERATAAAHLADVEQRLAACEVAAKQVAAVLAADIAANVIASSTPAQQVDLLAALVKDYRRQHSTLTADIEGALFTAEPGAGVMPKDERRRRSAVERVRLLGDDIRLFKREIMALHDEARSQLLSDTRRPYVTAADLTPPLPLEVVALRADRRIRRRIARVLRRL